MSKKERAVVQLYKYRYILKFQNTKFILLYVIFFYLKYLHDIYI